MQIRVFTTLRFWRLELLNITVFFSYVLHFLFLFFSYFCRVQCVETLFKALGYLHLLDFAC